MTSYLVLYEKRKLMKNFAMSALFGISALLLINLTGVFTGITIAVGRLSLCVSGILGIPGVILMVIFDQLI